MKEAPPKYRSLIDSFAPLEDPRIDRKKLYPLMEIVFLSICAVLSGFEEWDEVVDFGEEKLNWLRKYLPYEHGIPSHDTMNRVISLLDDRAFERCFINWVEMSISLPRWHPSSFHNLNHQANADAKLRLCSLYPRRLCRQQ